jgi:hypothetical protein
MEALIDGSVLVQLCDVRGLFAFGALNDFKLHFLAGRQGFEAVPSNGGEMNEQILAPVLFDESIALPGVKPLDSTRWHFPNPCLSASGCTIIALDAFQGVNLV